MLRARARLPSANLVSGEGAGTRPGRRHAGSIEASGDGQVPCSGKLDVGHACRVGTRRWRNDPRCRTRLAGRPRSSRTAQAAISDRRALCDRLVRPPIATSRAPPAGQRDEPLQRGVAFVAPDWAGRLGVERRAVVGKVVPIIEAPASVRLGAINVGFTDWLGLIKLIKHMAWHPRLILIWCAKFANDEVAKMNMHVAAWRWLHCSVCTESAKAVTVVAV